MNYVMLDRDFRTVYSFVRYRASFKYGILVWNGQAENAKYLMAVTQQKRIVRICMRKRTLESFSNNTTFNVIQTKIIILKK